MAKPMANPTPLEQIPLTQLELDPDNPRFGAQAGKFTDQAAILDYLVDNLGVDNLLPSLAINGYFIAEPLVVRPSQKTKGKYRIIEGNRRLASCLILAGDPRARNQAKRAENIAPIAKIKWTVNSTVPARIFPSGDDAKLLPYLGVRHIVAAQPWDSYAKAKWVSDITRSKQMTLEQIIRVIGDDNRTIIRMVEGYNFINQLSNAGLFKPENSVRRGRGSNPDFPFSWLYTLLGYPPVRKHLGLPEVISPDQSPIPQAKLSSAAETIGFLFGDREKGMNSAIADSRKLGALAGALGNPTMRVLLKQGKSIAEIEELSKPPEEQIVGCLSSASDNLGKALKLLSEGKIDASLAIHVREPAASVRRLAAEVHKKIESLIFDDTRNA